VDLAESLWSATVGDVELTNAGYRTVFIDSGMKSGSLRGPRMRVPFVERGGRLDFGGMPKVAQ
jgi:hypothetical protein